MQIIYILLLSILPFSAFGNDSSLFFLTGSLNMGLGEISSEDTITVESRKMFSYSLDSSLGIRYLGFIIGYNIERSKWNQRTTPSEVSNTNMQGKLEAAYPIFAYEYGSFRILGKLPFGSEVKYKLDKPNVLNQEVSYRNADVLNIQLHWMKSEHVFYGMGFQKLIFKEVENGSTVSILEESQYLILNSYSIIIGLTF